MENGLEGFIDFFKKVPDHRIERKKLHRVEEILFLTFCATIAGCDGWMISSFMERQSWIC